MRRYLDVPLVSILVLGFFSLLAAGLMFLVGGSLAEVSDQEGKFFGFTFEAGGAIAGFVIVFVLVAHRLEQFRKSTPIEAKFSIKIPAVDSVPTGFSQAKQYNCKYTLFSTGTGTRQEMSAEYTWEAGFLTVFVKDVLGQDLVRVRVEDGGQAWESEDFQPYTRSAQVRLISDDGS